MEVAELPSSPYFVVSKVFYESPVLQRDGQNGGPQPAGPPLNPPLVQRREPSVCVTV